jgi:hypothetical protein
MHIATFNARVGVNPARPAFVVMYRSGGTAVWRWRRSLTFTDEAKAQAAHDSNLFMGFASILVTEAEYLANGGCPTDFAGASYDVALPR